MPCPRPTHSAQHRINVRLEQVMPKVVRGKAIRCGLVCHAFMLQYRAGFFNSCVQARVQPTARCHAGPHRHSTASFRPSTEHLTSTLSLTLMLSILLLTYQEHSRYAFRHDSTTAWSSLALLQRSCSDQQCPPSPFHECPSCCMQTQNTH